MSSESSQSVALFYISGILLDVRTRMLLAAILVAATSLVRISLAALQTNLQTPQSEPPPEKQEPAKQPSNVPPVQGALPTPQVPIGPPQLPPATAPSRGLRVVVLDPGHGGTDAGARGKAGVLESEVVLNLSRVLRAELERQGLHVAMTRQGNDNPSFDDRSTIANGHRGAIFVTLHVSSTGTVGTARVYSTPLSVPTRDPKATGSLVPERRGVLPWDQAQAPYAEASRRLAELVQVQLAQRFRGSPEVPLSAPVRQLRTIATPAIAIELSSVTTSDRNKLEEMGRPLAEAVARSVVAFRPLYEGGAN